VNAVIEEPRGAHPSEVSGYYNMDLLFWAMMDLANRSEEGFRGWMKEWVYDGKLFRNWKIQWGEVQAVNTALILKNTNFTLLPPVILPIIMGIWLRSSQDRE
jgi:hypothetical protein